jgi:uncharacterized repeat protein (TIGR01451 family)
MKNLFLVILLAFISNFTSAQGSISLQCPTPTSYCDTSAANCDSMLNLAFYNVTLPNFPVGDLNFVYSSSISGSYALTMSINWGDGTTTTHQGSGSTLAGAMQISITPATNHLYQNAGSYPIVITYNINGGATAFINHTYHHVQCGLQYVPSTGSNSINCGVNSMIFDAGGNWGDYQNNSNGYTILNSSGNSQIHINGTYTQLETNYDSLKIFAGAGTTGQLLYAYNGSNGGTITPFTSAPGQPITVQLKSDATVTGSGFALQAIYSGSCGSANSFFFFTSIDCNGDGTSDSTMNSGLLVHLNNASNSYSGTVVNGNLVFQNMAPGTYSVSIDPDWLAAYGFVVNTLTPNQAIVANGGAFTSSVVLGCAPTSSVQCVSGIVFCDINNDGIYNNGEPPVYNAAVNVNYNGVNYVTYTSQSGAYSLNYTGITGDSIEVSVNSNWMNNSGCSSNAPTSVNATSQGCNLGIPPTPVNFAMNCTSGLPNNCYAGYVFCDVNNNGVMNAGESPIPFAPVYIGNATSGNTNVIVYTDSTGYFSYCGQFNSSNTVTAWLNAQWLGYQGYTATNTVLTLVGSTSANPIPGYFAVNCGGTGCADLWSTVTPWIGYFQNTTAHIRLNWGNYGPSAPGSYVLTFTFPSGVTPIVSSIQYPGYSINGNTITWNLNSSSTNFSMNDVISFNVPGGLLNGALHYYTSTITPVSQTDCNDANNAGSLLQILGNSYDPNDKIVQRSEMYTNSPFPVEYLDANVLDDLVYRIRFQNTGTAPAQNIYILDTLSSNLDWSTFQLIESTHPMQVVNLGNGQMRFEFPQIWLADSTTNEPESHGHLIYRIRENFGCVPGVEIENTAHIFFDWNEAIVTNTTYNINEFFGGLSKESALDLTVLPNPTSNFVNVELQGEFSYNLCDLEGRRVSFGSAKDTVQLQMNDLKSGIYLLHVNTTSGSETIRIVKVN